MSGCPDDAVVDAVLDHEAAAAVDAGVRAHVAACDACLARHGPRFEVELWATGLGRPRTTTTAPLPGSRLLERIAVAAALAAAASSMARIATSGDPVAPCAATTRAAEIDVLEFATRQRTSGPEGSVELRRTFGAPRGRFALMNEEEIRTGRDGVTVVHARCLPLCAAAKE